MFFASVTNITVFTVFFLPVPSKRYLRSFQNVARSTVLVPCQRHKNTVNYSVSGLLLGFVEGAEGAEGGS